MRICCVQMDMLPAEPEQNFSHAEELIRRAVRLQNPDVVLLPETWNTGFAPGKIDPVLADEDGQRTRSVFSALAKELGVNIVAGSVANRRGGKLYNTAYVFDRSGECLAVYDKTHLFSPMGEDMAFAKGDSLARFSIDGASCALIICYDLRFPELVRTLALLGLDILFIVSQWPDKRISHLEVLSRARAIENQMFVSLCNSCGEAFGTRFGGHSAVIDPWGTVLAQAGEAEEILSAEADLSVLQEIRGSIPVFRDRRAELYELDE
ncbi:MAG TPA: carbon-nitrogen family hydrolase [Feifaniaceae bacterium]|nr:carbon-nitrogen family hydrolase [Feifaniaceae bacterium]